MAELDQDRLNTNVSGFAFDRDNGEFQIYNPELEIISLDTLRTSPGAFVDALVFRENQVPLREVTVGAAILGLYLMGTPILQRYLTDTTNDLTQVLLETQKVMREVQSAMIDRDLSGEPLNAGFMGYNAEFLREGQPVLSVIGNCACLSVDYDGFMFDESDWDTGYTSWDAHNIDGDQQWASLYAGVGYLSYQASKT